MKEEEVRKGVREGYGKIARRDLAYSTSGISCCGTQDFVQDINEKIGSRKDDLELASEGAKLGFGCGSSFAQASLKQGDVALTLGLGAGFDCFLAAKTVGKIGKVICVDMNPKMVDRGREKAHKGNYQNVEFRLGEIENLPVADNRVNVIISNGVINLSTDKKKVFREAFRVLRPGGRLRVSDIVLLKELPEEIKKSVAAYIGCLAGAVSKGLSGSHTGSRVPGDQSNGRSGFPSGVSGQ